MAARGVGRVTDARRSTSVRVHPFESPISIAWSPDEYDAVLHAAGPETVSRFVDRVISEACWTRAADGSIVRLPAGVADAAAAARMPLRQWIRVLVLGAIGYAPLDVQIEHARRYLETGVGNDVR